ncbi:hypothetical protein GCM10027348_00850 [Hymenobacter tenuis]
MKLPYSIALVGLCVLSFASCREDPAPSVVVPCTRVKMLGPSCNGTLLQIQEDNKGGKSITYQGTLYPNVVGTYSALPDTLVAGDELVVALRTATATEATPRPCLAIYQTYDVPQMVVESPRCPK